MDFKSNYLIVMTFPKSKDHCKKKLRIRVKKKCTGDFPGGPCLQGQGHRVRFLVREIRSHILHGAPSETKKIEEKIKCKPDFKMIIIRVKKTKQNRKFYQTAVEVRNTASVLL